MKYDDAGYQTAGGKSEDEAIAPSALFFRWCAENGLVSEFHTEEEEFEAFESGEMTASDYLWEMTSGKFTDEDLTDEGNRFARSYFGGGGVSPGKYFRDLNEIAGKKPNEFSESQCDFGRLSVRIGQRFAESKESVEQKPWWNFWS